MILLLGLLSFTASACAGEEVEPQDLPPEAQAEVEEVTREVEQRLDALEQRIDELEPSIRQQLDQGLEDIRQDIRELPTEP